MKLSAVYPYLKQTGQIQELKTEAEYVQFDSVNILIKVLLKVTCSTWR